MKNLKNEIIQNQEKRISELKDFEKYINNYYELIKKEPNRNWDYNTRMKIYLQNAQNLNNELRKLQNNNIEINKIIEKLLFLEKNNFELTIKSFQHKLKIHYLEKNDADEFDILKIEKELEELRNNQNYFRDEINDIVTRLKYDIN